MNDILSELYAGPEIPAGAPGPARRWQRKTIVWMLYVEDWEAIKALPVNSAMALAFIEACARGMRRGQWVTIPKSIRDNYSRNWWSRALNPLIQAGLVEREQLPGRVPRLRILIKRKAKG